MSRIDGWLHVEGCRASLGPLGLLPGEGQQAISFPLRDAAAAATALRQLLDVATQTTFKTLTVSLAGVWLRWDSRPWGSTARPDWIGMSSQAFGTPHVEAHIPEPLMQVFEEYSAVFRLRFCSVPEAAFQTSQAAPRKAIAVLAVLEEGCLTCIRYQGHRWLEVVAFPDDITEKADLEMAWRRLQLRHPTFSACEQWELVDMAAVFEMGDRPHGVSCVIRPSISTLSWQRISPLLDWPFRRRVWDTKAFTLLAASLLFLGISVFWFVWLGQQKAELVEKLAMRTESQPLVALSDAERKRVSLEIANANEVIHYLNTPVDALLLAIAPVKPTEVVLLSLQIKAGRSHSLMLEGEATSMNSLVSYVESLSQQAVFSSVWLTRHEVRSVEDGKPYLFSIEAEWAQ